MSFKSHFTILVVTDKWFLARMNSIMGLEISLFIKGLPTTVKVTHEGLYSLMCSHVNFQSANTIVLFITSVDFTFERFVTGVIGNVGF
jgi:hypothetical protein